MILATVITCPQRWEHYQRFLRNFGRAGVGVAVRTFQTKEAAGDAFANNNLNARAALAYGKRHLPEGGWLLYLEDDVVISPALAMVLPELVRMGEAEGVDCWNLCNRKNAVARQFRLGLSAGAAQAGEVVVNELRYPVSGAHGLLIPKRHLGAMVAGHWSQVSDLSMFEALHHPGLKIWQVVKPVLVEHIGYVSTYDPEQRPKILEVNHAD
jgi:hypothetical protein